jgi:hypothetical protein
MAEVPKVISSSEELVVHGRIILKCILMEYYIVTCRGRVTKIAGSRSDDWIYWHIGYKFS